MPSLYHFRIDDEEVRFHYIRRINKVYYYSLERDISESKSVFRLWCIDLNQTNQVHEIEFLKLEIQDKDDMMALQVLFVSHETQKRYRDPNLEES